MKKTFFILLSFCVVLFLCACSTSQANLDEDMKESDYFEASKPEGVVNEENEIFLSEPLLSTGETMHTLWPLDKDDNNPGLDITLHSAALFHSPEEAGLDRSQMIQRTENYNSLGEPEWQSIDDSKILLCKFTIENINAVNSYDSDLHIGTISIVGTISSSEKVTLISNQPAYFSASISSPEKSNYYHYLIPKGKSKEVTVAWFISPEINPENLYVCSIFDTDDKNNRQYFQLDLH